ncbi:MAG: hypothetical protein RI894_2618 [Bacteroidota bacterium]|jgi:hypothetical protein
MRILGIIEHPQVRIQVFQFGNRFSVKMEAGMYEQNYKFRESPLLQGLSDIQKIVDAAFVERAFKVFDEMHALSGEGWQRFEALHTRADDDWEEII